ncbi:MAG TPA: hypothetical protein VFE90_18200 [Myxococcales bacterium]|jgi:CheY-like chemotaxis protein|nr:hypothetical protein [Myxococcales bacterium]
MRILLVNYDRDSCEALSGVFGDEGWETLIAADVPHGIAVLETDSAVDLVLLRQLRPDARVVRSFLEEKRQRPGIAAVPVIVTCAFLVLPDRLDGVVRVLREPLEIELVISAVEEATGKRR